MTSITTAIALLSLLILSSEGHTYLSSVVVGGAPQNPGDCLRPYYGGPTNPLYVNAPVNDVSTLTAGLAGPNMTCGFLPYAANPANRKCPVTAGSKMGLQWYHEGPSAADMIIDGSHKGPCLVYMARSDTGAGKVWFKVYEEGYNPTTQKFCSIRVKEARGLLEFTIPPTLPSGNYLVRGEIIALHDGTKTNGAQPYVYCAEVTVSGPANGVLPTDPYLTTIPGAPGYGVSDPGILFNLYNGVSSYPIPGPPLYSATATSQQTNQQTSQQTQQTSQQTNQQTSQQTNQQTSRQTSQQNTQPTSAGNCNDIITQCKTLCGERDIVTCSCVNGSPSISCADAVSSSASSLRPFWL